MSKKNISAKKGGTSAAKKAPAQRRTRKKSGTRTPNKMSAWFKFYTDSDNRETFLNKTGAARAAKYKAKSDASFANIGLQNYKKLEDKIKQWLDEEGMSEAALKRKLVEGMECTETIFKGHEIKGLCYIVYNGQAYKLEEALLSENEELQDMAKQVLIRDNNATDGTLIDTGYMIETREVIPWDVRRKYIVECAKIRGMYKKDNEQKKPEVIIADDIPPEKQAALNKAYQQVLKCHDEDNE